MKKSKIAIRYARGLFELALEENLLEPVHKDMQLVAEVLDSNRELVKVLTNPVIFMEKKLAILKAVFGEKVQTMSLLFLEVIVKKTREPLIREIALQFIHQYNAHKGILMACLITSVPATTAFGDQIRERLQQLTGLQIALKQEVDVQLIGGFVLRFEDLQYDASIASRLQQLKREFEVNVIEKGI